MKNRYEIIETGTEVFLTNEFGETHSVIVEKRTVIIKANGFNREWQILIDEEDLHLVDSIATGSWYIGVSKGTIYARYCKREKESREYILMHRLITDCPDEYVVDHNPHHYGLDNRRENLTITTLSDNCKNLILDKRKNGYTKKI